MTADGADLAVAVAGHGLPSARLSWPDAPLPDPRWRELVSRVFRQKLLGLLAACVADGSLPVTEEQRDEVAHRHRMAMVGVLAVEAKLLEAGGALSRDRIAWRVLKGSAAAHLDYPDPSMRVFGDADLLVRGADVFDAVEALRTVGAERTHPPLGHGFDQRFAKSVELVDGGGLEIDLHRTLALEPFGLRIVEDDLFAATETFVVGGRPLTALDPTLRLLHAAYHVSLGSFPVKLSPLRDLAALATNGRADRRSAVDLARRWWARAVLADALVRAWEAFRLPAGDPWIRWARDYRPTGRETVGLAAFQRPDRRQAHRTVATLRTLPGMRDRAAYLRVMLNPDRAYLANRKLGLAGWLRRGRGALQGGPSA